LRQHRRGPTIARAAVRAELAACGNIHGPITAIYRWAGTLVEGEEHVLVLKTTTACLPALEPLMRAHHSYDLPAILVMAIHADEPAYLDWIGQESRGWPQGPTDSSA
jgi:periplasmic divalent cation tolerance protein